ARVAETGHRLLGELTAFVAFGGASLLLTLSAVHPAARPSIWQGALLPAIVFGVGLVLGVLRADADRGAETHGRLATWVASVHPRVRAGLRAALTAGAASVMLVMLVSAVTATVVLATGYAQVIRLYEALHTEVLGGIVLTAGEVAVVADGGGWGAAWVAGPGVAVGVGARA